jgi:hypothetical protein
LPLPYVAVLAGFVAAVCPLSALAVTVVASSHVSEPFLIPAYLLVPACTCAAVVMLCIAIPMHAGLVRIGFANPWTHVAGMLVIMGSIFLALMFLGEVAPVEAVRHPIGSLSFLVPIAAIPSGLFFHAVTHKMRFIPPCDRRDALIFAAWLGAWIMMVVGLCMDRHFAPDPLHTRQEIVRLATTYGTGAFMLSGVLGGLARLRSLRLASFVAAAGWVIPLGCSAVYFATPLGPDRIRFTAAGRSFVVDWHLDPRSEGAGFNFDATKRGPYEIAGRRQFNRRIRISGQAGPLAPEWRSAIDADRGSTFQWVNAGLQCEQRESDGRPRQICVARDDAGRTTTLIDCRPGYCAHRFDRGGLRYLLLIDGDDLRNWVEIQERAVRLVADVTGDAG